MPPAKRVGQDKATTPGVYRGPRPFGRVLLKHCAAARLLGIRPKTLTHLPVKREFYQNTYVYDAVEIEALAATRNPT